MSDLVGWCKCAQDEQINQSVGHVYANYRHSHALELVPPTAVAGFECGLSKIAPIHPARLSIGENKDFGLTQIAIDRAAAQFFSSPDCASHDDFRTAGQKFFYGGMLISLWYRPSPVRPASSGSTSVRPYPTISTKTPPRVVWLTKPESVLKAVTGELTLSGKRKLTETQFYGLLVALLGLRPRGPMADNADCTMFAYRLLPRRLLSRPHVFSQGYPERFCGVSPFGTFGATASNRTGTAGLPEAICYETSLEKLDIASPDMMDFITKLRALIDFSPLTLHTLTLTLPMSDLHAQDDMDLARSTILRRMRRAQPNVPCTIASAVGGICEGHHGKKCS